MTALLRLPNYLLGEYRESPQERLLRDYAGHPCATAFGATDADLRRVKRNLASLAEELRAVPLDGVIRVIQATAHHYFSRDNDVATLVRLTGSPQHCLQTSLGELRGWAARIDDFVHRCFGGADYARIPLRSNGRTLSFEKHVPAGPVVGILPRNSEAESIYLLVQILLARCPALVKAPSALGSSFASLEFIRALNLAIDESADPSLEPLRRALHVVNIFTDDKADILRRLEVAGATYIVFGSDETIAQIERSLTSPARKLIKMGTGLSLSVVLGDCDVRRAAELVCRSAALDRGNDCISTKIVYVHSAIRDCFLAATASVADCFETGDPLRSDSIVGQIHPDDANDITARLRRWGLDHYLRGVPETLHLSLVPLEEGTPFAELPGPVLGVRTFENLDHLYRLVRRDLEQNRLEKNLVTSVFTQDADAFDSLTSRIASHTFKRNRASVDMDLCLEHQGRYLLRDMLDKRIVEENLP